MKKYKIYITDIYICLNISIISFWVHIRKKREGTIISLIGLYLVTLQMKYYQYALRRTTT